MRAAIINCKRGKSKILIHQSSWRNKGNAVAMMTKEPKADKMILTIISMDIDASFGGTNFVVVPLGTLIYESVLKVYYL